MSQQEASSSLRALRPRGTVTLLMSDIEGSTRLLKQLGRSYAALLDQHAAILREEASRFAGQEVDTQGDAFFFAFHAARDAVAAATAIQRRLAAATWPGECPVKVRIGVHTGEPDVTEAGRYVGLDVHRVARICAAAHGGQVVCSALSAEMTRGEIPDGVTLRGLGEVQLKDLDEPERLCELVIADMPADFPPLRAGRPTAFAGAEDALAAELTAATGQEGGESSVAPPVEVRVLGPVEFARDGRIVPISAARLRMVLATLALRFGEVVSGDELQETIWGERPPPTAAKSIQVFVSDLRKLIEEEPRTPRLLVTQPPGYRLVGADTLVDLHRFEQRWEQGRDSLARGDPKAARDQLRVALSLWRGDPLAEFHYEDAFSLEIGRLEEMRLACIEDRIDADLGLGDHTAVVGELQHLVRRHPLRERLRGQLMLALYRSGRQADALAAYQEARHVLVDELGIDPSPALAALERQILQQDAALNAPASEVPLRTSLVTLAQTQTVVLLSQSSRDLDALVSFGEAIGIDSAARDLVLARIVEVLPGRNERKLRDVTRGLVERRDVLLKRGISARVAAFSSASPASDITKLALHQSAQLVVVDGTQALLGGRAGLVDELLAELPCDVALHLARAEQPHGEAIMVPFTGSEHDWAALELAAAIARATGAALVLIGAEADAEGRDASRLLATASLILQRVTGVVGEPLLVHAGAQGIIDAAGDAAHILTGLSPRFREDGLGEARATLAQRAPTSLTLVRRGARPGVLAPPEGLTRFTWSLGSRRVR